VVKCAQGGSDWYPEALVGALPGAVPRSDRRRLM